MCYCDPNKRTPFCDNCKQMLIAEIKTLKSNYNKLVGFVTRLAARTHSKDNLADIYDARALLYEIGEAKR